MILHLASFAVRTQSREECVTIFVYEKLMEGEKYIYMIYILYVWVFQREPCLRHMNRFKSLETHATI